MTTADPDQADTDQADHAAWCKHPVIRSSEDFFSRGAIRTRCLGCGATRTTLPVTAPRERCQMLLRTGFTCRNTARPGSLLCHIHGRYGEGSAR